VIESRRGFGFLNKTIQLIRVLAEFFVQEFDCHFAIKFCVLRQIHLAHSAFADLGDDAVMSDDRVWGYAFAQIVSLPFWRAGPYLIEIIPAD